MAQAVIIPSAAQTSVIKCKLCESSGEFFCKECPSALCKPCREKHDMLLGGHTVVNIKTIDRSAFSISSNSKCSKHHQQFKLFCNQCQSLVCIECVAEDHNSHSTSLIEKIVAKLRESIDGDVALMKGKIEKISEVLEKTKSEKLPKLEVDLQTVSKDIDSTLRSIQQSIDDRKDIKTTEYEDFKKLQDLDITKELKRRENVLAEYRNICNSFEKMLAENHAVTFYISYNNLRKDIEEFDDEILKDIDLPIVPEFKHASFVEEIVNEICAKFEVRSINPRDEEVKQRRIDKLTEEYEAMKTDHSEKTSQLKDDIKSLQSERDISEKKVMEFLQQKRKDDIQISELMDEKRVLEQRARNLDETRFIAQILQLSNQKEVLEQKIRDLENKVFIEIHKYEGLSEGIVEERNQMEQTLDTTRTQYNAQIENLKQRECKLEEEIKELKQRLSNTASSCEQEMCQLKLQLRNIRDAPQNKHTLETDLLRQRIVMVEKTSSKYCKEIEDYKTRSLTATNTIAAYQREIEDYKTRSLTATNTIAAYQREIEDYKTRSMAATNTIAAYQREIEDYKTKILTASNTTAAYQRENEDYKTKIVTANTTITNYFYETENYKTRSLTATNAITTYKREIEDYKTKILTANNTIAAYQREIEDNKARILTANNTIASYQREIEGCRKPVICKYVCTQCSFITNSSVRQGQAPVLNCRCGFNRPSTYCGAAS